MFFFFSIFTLNVHIGYWLNFWFYFDAILKESPNLTADVYHWGLYHSCNAQWCEMKVFFFPVGSIPTALRYRNEFLKLPPIPSHYKMISQT